jgi:hypothetical protein
VAVGDHETGAVNETDGLHRIAAIAIVGRTPDVRTTDCEVEVSSRDVGPWMMKCSQIARATTSAAPATEVGLPLDLGIPDGRSPARPRGQLAHRTLPLSRIASTHSSPYS